VPNIGGGGARKRATGVNRLKQRLTFANVLSCMALFVALGGGVAVAAGKIGPGSVKAANLAKEAVTNPKLKKQAVTSGKIKNGNVNAADLGTGSVINSKLAKKAVTNAKLGNESVGTSKLAKKSVTEAQLAAEAIGTGKIDNEAITAAKISTTVWRQLLKNVTYVTETSVNDSVTFKAVTATCPVGKEVLGGGVKINGASASDEAGVVVSESAPVVSATNTRVGWVAGGREIGTKETGSWQVVAYAICAEL
jgi:hypothetical protein